MIWPILPPASQSQRSDSPGLTSSGENHLERPGQRRGGRRVSLRHPQRDRVEQDVDRTRRHGTGRCGARGLGRLPHAGTGQVAGPDRGHQGVQMRRAGQVGVDRLEAPGRAEQQPIRVAAAPLFKGDLPAQALHLRGLQRIQRAGLDRDQQPQRRIQRPGVAIWPAPPRAAAASGEPGRASAAPRAPGTRPPRPGPRGPAPAPPSAPARRRPPHPGPARPAARCQARRSGSSCGSVTSASARWTSCLS